MTEIYRFSWSREWITSSQPPLLPEALAVSHTPQKPPSSKFNSSYIITPFKFLNFLEHAAAQHLKLYNTDKPGVTQQIGWDVM